MKNSIAVVMPIHNQESIIESIIDNLFINMSDNIEELVFIIDGCTDRTEEKLRLSLQKQNKNRMSRLWAEIHHADDVFEVLACNMGYKSVTSKYILDIQADMLITEKDFDIRLLKPFSISDSILGVTARNAQNEVLASEEELTWSNVFGKDVSSPRDIFGIRDVIVRGPILWDHSKVKRLGYLDEEFQPQDNDEKNLCFSGYQKYGYLVGAYRIEYQSEASWGSTRKSQNAQNIQRWSKLKNDKILIERYRDLITGKKHDTDICLL